MAVVEDVVFTTREIAYTVLVQILETISPTVKNSIELIALAVTVPFGNIETPARVDGPRSIAYPTLVLYPITRIRTIADAISIRVCISDTIVDIVTNTIEVDIFRPTAITIPRRYILTTAGVDSTRTIANSAFIELSNAIIEAVIITNAISINILQTRSTADKQGVQLIAITIAISFRYPRASAIVYRARTIANSTLVCILTKGLEMHGGCRVVCTGIFTGAPQLLVNPLNPSLSAQEHTSYTPCFCDLPSITIPEDDVPRLLAIRNQIR